MDNLKLHSGFSINMDAGKFGFKYYLDELGHLWRGPENGIGYKYSRLEGWAFGKEVWVLGKYAVEDTWQEVDGQTVINCLRNHGNGNQG